MTDPIGREELIARVSEDAALYCLGTASATEAENFEARLAAGCQFCRYELQECERGMVGYLETLAADPPVAIGGAVVAALSATQVQQYTPNPLAGFLPTEVAGVWQRPIFGGIDGPLAKLVRLQAGAAYPAHQHRQNEHCYVLEGSFERNGTFYGPGSCEAFPPGTFHESVTSPEGCLILVVEF